MFKVLVSPTILLIEAYNKHHYSNISVASVVVMCIGASVMFISDVATSMGGLLVGTVACLSNAFYTIVSLPACLPPLLRTRCGVSGGMDSDLAPICLLFTHPLEHSGWAVSRKLWTAHRTNLS